MFILIDIKFLSKYYIHIFVFQPAAKLVYHSLVGHATLDSLLHPLHAYTSPHTSHTLTSYTPLKQPFPCDFHLVNLRSLLDNARENAESALILHKRGFDCGFDVGPLSCTLAEGEVGVCVIMVNFQKLFLFVFSICL